MLKKILIGLAVIVAGFLAFVASRPAHYHVERSVAISAPAEIVYAELEDLHRWQAWSPFEKMDPNMKKTFEGPPRGVGASYTWEGNSEAGKGRMTVSRAEPVKQISYKLEFMEPMAGLAEANMEIESSVQNTQKLTWGIDGENNFVGKMFCVFMDMDKMIGAQFETGLAQLKVIAEKETQKQREAAQTAAAQPATEAPKPSEGSGP